MSDATIKGRFRVTAKAVVIRKDGQREELPEQDLGVHNINLPASAYLKEGEPPRKE